jgi:penicillin-binding protein 1A
MAFFDMRIFSIAFTMVVTATVALISFALGFIIYSVSHPVFELNALDHVQQAQPTILLDDTGVEWARFYSDRKEPISISVIPDHVIHAFLAAEDRSFFNHAGISWRGIFRSLLVNLYHRKKVQGASTITQQLVRLLYFDANKTFIRKIKEQCVALLLERQLSKQQIMEMYLNNVYFGCGIYGIAAAAQRFWKKQVSDLTIDEAAALAAIMKSPQKYCPLLFPLSCKQRRDTVLRGMFYCSFINQEQLDNALKMPLEMVTAEVVCAPHAKEAIRGFLEPIVGADALYKGGLVIQTTINKDLQIRANELFKNHIIQLRSSMMPEIDGSLMTIEVKTGQIKAVVGGFDFSISQFDRALQAKRQFGSIFKPLIYAAAVEKGINFSMTEVDEPLEITMNSIAWRPENFSNDFKGQMTLAYALSHSNNIVTIKTLMKIGTARVIELARQVGITAVLQPYPSLALGCLDGTLKEAVGMFNIFAHNGLYLQPHLVRWVKDKWGTKIWKKNSDAVRAISPRVCGQVAKVLSSRLAKLKKRSPHALLTDAIGKTGTTNNCRSCWFLGSTPHYTTGVYIGCDDNRSLGRHVYGSATAFPLWLKMQELLADCQQQFVYDPSLRELIIHEKTGAVCSFADQSALSILV